MMTEQGRASPGGGFEAVELCVFLCSNILPNLLIRFITKLLNLLLVIRCMMCKFVLRLLNCLNPTNAISHGTEIDIT